MAEEALAGQIALPVEHEPSDSKGDTLNRRPTPLSTITYAYLYIFSFDKSSIILIMMRNRPQAGTSTSGKYYTDFYFHSGVPYLHTPTRRSRACVSAGWKTAGYGLIFFLSSNGDKMRTTTAATKPQSNPAPARP
ncbi:hypothetical protein EVAR_877_1 [Eumeta japonica]|uniref:Uncharacterized protein n=1 Tax=Eumeta variegata TaxID=151549 RepID=A0A4C1SGN8_EUMVA|nr:hypothetical protein EVAR_877_1 [Eumeta japonica]